MPVTSSKMTFDLKKAVPSGEPAIFLIITEGQTHLAHPLLTEKDQDAANRVLSASVVRGKAREVGFDIVELSGGRYRRVYLLGVGPAGEANEEMVRRAGGAAARALRKHRIKSASFLPGPVGALSPAQVVQGFVSGAMLADFNFDEYRGAGQSPDDRKADGSLNISVIADAASGGIRAALNEARAIADGQNFARTIASRPGNNISPPTLASAAVAMAREVGLKSRVLDEKELARLGMGGILGVGAGSIATPPRLIVLEHNPSGQAKSRNRQSLLVVGKSITFDSGGISIKPAEKMGRMIYDKCGGMAVLGLMYAVARLDLPIRVVGILSSAENAISEKAYRPGDILRLYNGVTVEVTNTDAEGRLVLGDALAWGIETYKPSAVIDLATLTGGVVTALGKTMAGVMANNDALVEELNRAADAAGEKIWRLPLGPEQREQIKSDMADIVNSAGREAHPLQGGAFLSYFVPPEVPWAHLDIAGVADTEKELPYYGRGATGWGVRTLVQWVRQRI